MLSLYSSRICSDSSALHIPWTHVSTDIIRFHRHFPISFCRKVRLGEYETLNPRDDCSSGTCIPTAYEIDVDKKIVHRDFDGSKNDIGLLRMAKSVQYSGNEMS